MSPKSAIYLVGRLGLEPRTRELKVDVTAWPAVARYRPASAELRWSRRVSLTVADCRALWRVKTWVSQPWDGSWDPLVRCSPAGALLSVGRPSIDASANPNRDPPRTVAQNPIGVPRYSARSARRSSARASAASIFN